jgi:hypothetical protein
VGVGILHSDRNIEPNVFVCVCTIDVGTLQEACGI